MAMLIEWTTNLYYPYFIILTPIGSSASSPVNHNVEVENLSASIFLCVAY